ncbi:MAG: type II toxin-antitoxin system PemK/MazF family toxin [Cellulomonadaceae bacterium]
MSTGGWTGLLSRALRIAGDVVRAPDSGRGRPDRRASSPQTAYPGDFTGTVRPAYAPDLDGDADPGEIVWTWVPYEEDHSQGKDRPVLVVGHDGPWLLGLMLTSKDHGRGTSSRPGGPTWIDIGAGPWDAKGRESEVRIDRVVRINPGQVRREGAIMDQALFDRVTALLT